MALAVRVHARFPGVQKILAGLILAATSALFVVGGLASSSLSFGGVFFLVLGVTGLSLCVGAAVLSVGNVVSRRPVLVLDDDEVRVPAAWPLPRRADRVLPWQDLMAVCAWTQGPPTGRRAAALGQLYLSFLPPGKGMESGAELLATKVASAGCLATLRWTVRVRTGWDTTVEQLVAEVSRHRAEAAFIDRRDPPKPNRKPRKGPRKVPTTRRPAPRE